jgi:hypothetical protein
VGHELDASNHPGDERVARRTLLPALGNDHVGFAVLDTDDPLAATPTRSSSASSPSGTPADRAWSSVLVQDTGMGSDTAVQPTIRTRQR